MFGGLLLMVVGLAALPVHAQVDLGGAIQFGRGQGGLSSRTFQELIVAIGNWLLGLVVGLSMLALVVGGIMYVTSLGGEQGTSRAKRILFYAVIGLIVSILHVLIVNTLCNWLNVPCPVTAPVTWQQLISNIGNFLLGLVSFLAMAAVVWGGVRYITALGDEGQVAEAKRILLGAIVGMIYVGLHVAFVMAACEVVGNPDDIACPSGNAIQVLGDVILRAVGIVLGLVSVLAFAAIVYGAYLYILSYGQEDRASQAKRVLIYAVVGVAVAALSAMVVNIVIGIL
jgi:hypothetical protein